MLEDTKKKGKDWQLRHIFAYWWCVWVCLKGKVDWRQYHWLKRGRPGKNVPSIDFSCSPPTHLWTLKGWNTNDNYSEQIQKLRIPAQQSVPPGAGSCTHGGARRGRSAAPGSGPVRPGSSVQDFVGQDFVTDSEDSSS